MHAQTHLFESRQGNQDLILFLQVLLENHFLDFTCGYIISSHSLRYITSHTIPSISFL